MKKVLIVIGDAGGGHIACARAIHQAFKKKDRGLEIDTIDLFSLNRFTLNYDFIYSLVSRYRVVEFFFNIGYRLIDKSYIFSEIVFFFSVMPLCKATLEFLKKERPDLVVCNNGPTARVLSKCKKEVGFKYVITVPDLGTVSRWWADRNADIIFTPTNEAEKRLKSYSPNINTVTPYYPLKEIPVYSKKGVDILKDEIFKEYSLEKDIPLILITGCGWGTRVIVNRLESFFNNCSYQLIIITGKDEKLRRELESKYSMNRRISIKGYTKSILDLFVVSDLVIAKPGPATLLELEKLGKKAIFTHPIGYQEWGNVDYLKKNPNFIYVGNKFNKIPESIHTLLNSKEREYISNMEDSNSIVEYIFKKLY